MVDENTAADEAVDDAEETQDEANDEQDAADTGDADALGDAGKRALDAMKAKWKAERDRSRDLQRQLEDAAKPKGDDDAPDLDAIRKQARDEARQETLRERVLDKIEAKASKGFKDPEDAILRLGRNIDDYIDDGKIDLQAIEDDLADLLKKRPDFGVTQGDAKRFKGSADGGKRGQGEGKPQLSRQDIQRMFKEGKSAEIEAARREGRLNDVLGITK